MSVFQLFPIINQIFLYSIPFNHFHSKLCFESIFIFIKIKHVLNSPPKLFLLLTLSFMYIPDNSNGGDIQFSADVSGHKYIFLKEA